jgi:uncharacterized membrane protein YdbT with pleckstrin-like domain
MGYVDKNLIPGETVVYRGSLSKLPYWWLVIPAAAAVVSGIQQWWIPGGVALALTAVTWSSIRLRLGATEFAVTTRRVLIKAGVLQRRTVEMMLGQVEGVTVDQGIWGRIFNYGSITVIGSGGTREAFDRIRAPLEFRRQVQIQLARQDDERKGLAGSPPGSTNS